MFKRGCEIYSATSAKEKSIPSSPDLFFRGMDILILHESCCNIRQEELTFVHPKPGLWVLVVLGMSVFHDVHMCQYTHSPNE